jgi:hypothetical protein
MPGKAIGGSVQVSQILKEIDDEIGRLQQARNLLAGEVARRPGRQKSKAAAPPPKKKRKLSPDGRRRIAEAMKRRWMERRKEAEAKAAKAVPAKAK